MFSGTNANAVCYIQLEDNGRLKTGVTSDRDTISASLNAVLSYF